MSWVAFIVDWLNRYANLLLVSITAVYVYLTWKTLKALERANLRELEAQHLADIKTQVVSPILQWLEFVVVEKLQGRGDPVGIMYALGYEPSLHAPRQLYPPNLQQIEGFSPDLYEHAMQEHFVQLRKYKAFREMVEQFFGTLAGFGNKCCADIRALTSLPRYDGNRSKDYVDCEGAVQFCLREIVGGREPKFYITSDLGVTTVTTVYSAEGVVRGPDEEVNRWLDASRKQIENSWSDTRLRERIQRTLDDAEKLRDTIRQIELTYALPKSCKYVRD
jgi:hypothetical protein